LRGPEQLGPNGLSGAGHKRRRHGTNDIGKATNGSSGEAENAHTKKTKLETTSADNTIAQRKEGNSSGNIVAQAAAAMTAAMAVRAVQGGTRRLAGARRRGF
jgi:hypothetical protein